MVKRHERVKGRGDVGVVPLPHTVQEAVREILKELGEDPDREGIRRTPERVERALRFLTQGYGADPVKVCGPLFREHYNEMVLVRDIELYSLCEHHLLPFFGKAHVAYIPDGYVMGLSKIAWIVDLYARRLQLQERLTEQIADQLQNCLSAKGVAVIIEASHLCMMMRGVEKQHSRTVTSAMRGCFLDDQKSREEFLRLALNRTDR